MAGVMLVTGGSRGIGAACARLGAKKGYKVCVNYVNHAAAANDVVGAIEAGGGEAMAVQADVSLEADVLRLYEAMDAHFGRLTALVNNAGILPLMGPISLVNEERLNRLWQVNITGQFLVAREAVKRMSTATSGDGGAIVNISSVGARMGGGGQFVDYAASKGAIDTMTRGLAQEVAAQGIRVNAVRPGVIDTEFHASSGNADRAAQLAPTIPMQRAGGAEEVAETVLYLLSEQASYVTGTIVDVSGGR